MSVAKITEITAKSTEGFDDAVRLGIVRAAKTLDNIKSAWISDQRVEVENGKVTGFFVSMKLTFVLTD